MTSADQQDPSPSTAEWSERPSEGCPSLTLLQGPQAFAKHLQRILRSARRQVYIFSRCLDHDLYANQSICSSLSSLARRHRQSEVFIIVKSPTALSGRYHALVELQQRLTSKIHLRKLALGQEQSGDSRSYVIVDGRQLLFQHDDEVYNGFCDTDAAPQAHALLEEFKGLWSRQTAEIPEVRQLSL